MNVLITGITVVAMALLIVAALSIGVAFQYQRVLFRLGRVVGVRRPGLNLIIPIIDRQTSFAASSTQL